MLGNPGSNPLELFWDLVDGLDQKLDTKVAIAETAMKHHNENLPKPPAEEKEGETDGEQQNGQVSQAFKFTPETTKEEFLEAIKGDEGVRALSADDLDEIFVTVRRVSVTVTISTYVEIALDARPSGQASGRREASLREETTSLAR